MKFPFSVVHAFLGQFISPLILLVRTNLQEYIYNLNGNSCLDLKDLAKEVPTAEKPGSVSTIHLNKGEK